MTEQLVEDLKRFIPAPPLPDHNELLQDVAGELDVVVSMPANSRPRLPRRFFLRQGPLAIAASVLLALLLLGAIVSDRLAASLIYQASVYETTPGEQREVFLADQSVVRLGGDTRLLVRFSPRARHIELERGGAFFQVQHDVLRPFVVHSDGGSITALGTAFEVRRYADHVQVWVREGVVEVSPLKQLTVDAIEVAPEAKAKAVRVARGEQVSYDSLGRQTTPSAVDPHLAAGWMEGQLVPLIYHGRRLADVIADIQPFTRHEVSLEPGLASLQYSGIVKQEDVDAWIHDLDAIYPVEVVDCEFSQGKKTHPSGCDDPKRILIRPRWSGLSDGAKSAAR